MDAPGSIWTTSNHPKPDPRPDNCTKGDEKTYIASQKAHSNGHHSYIPSGYPLNPGTQSHMVAKSPEETQTEALPRSNQTVAEDFELNVEASFFTIDPTCSCFILNFTLIEF